METVTGLVVFTLGLGVFLFPDAAATAVGEPLDRKVGHRATVLVRTLGIVAMVGGFGLLLV